MEAVFKFYDQHGYKFGEIRCDDRTPKFRHLVASGYSYWQDPRQQGARGGLSVNLVDTRGQYEKLVAVE